MKLIFLHTGRDLLVFISTGLSLFAGDVIITYRKRWNIEQGYEDLRVHFGFVRRKSAS